MYELFVIAISILLLDFIWIKFIFGNIFTNMVENIQQSRLQLNYYAAIFAYICMILGQYFFILPLLKHSNNIQTAFMYGFLFGFITFGIFDFTNLALFKNYNLSIALTDILWGSILNGIVAIILFKYTEYRVN